jgi:hypothetical protein
MSDFDFLKLDKAIETLSNLGIMNEWLLPLIWRTIGFIFVITELSSSDHRIKHLVFEAIT